MNEDTGGLEDFMEGSFPSQQNREISLIKPKVKKVTLPSIIFVVTKSRLGNGPAERFRMTFTFDLDQQEILSDHHRMKEHQVQPFQNLQYKPHLTRNILLQSYPLILISINL